MKKISFLLIATAAITLVAISVYAASYSLIEIKSTKPQAVGAGAGVSLLKYVEVIGALPATATVTVSRISGTVTSTVATVACTSGNGGGAAIANSYIAAGDSLLQSGATNVPQVRIITEL